MCYTSIIEQNAAVFRSILGENNVVEHHSGIQFDEQSLNAPVGKYAAFAYTAALNHLLADRENVHRIGDTTVVCWAEGAEPQYGLFAGMSLFGDSLLDRADS